MHKVFTKWAFSFTGDSVGFNVCLGLGSKIEKLYSIANHCHGVELVWKEVQERKNLEPKNSESNFIPKNSPIADIIPNHSIYDNCWVVQQLVPRQAEKSWGKYECKILAGPMGRRISHDKTFLLLFFYCRITNTHSHYCVFFYIIFNPLPHLGNT